MAAEQHYRDFIDEAFIQPIRAVLIVDDDYPTIDSILRRQQDAVEGASPPKPRRWEQQPERIRAMMDRLRGHSPALLIDVLDGPDQAESSDGISERLHQSDLLVLDYQLEGSGMGSGEEALRILGELLRNRHFNIVIVYSQEDAETVFEKVLLRLLNPSGQHLSGADRQRAKELVTDASDVHEDFTRQIRKSIGSPQYLYFRRHSGGYESAIVRGQPPYADYGRLATQAGWRPEVKKLVARLLLEDYEDTTLSERSPAPEARWMIWGERDRRWIKAESLFVAFVQKSKDDDVLQELREALYDWGPEPSRLLGSKTRAEMEAVGITAQDAVLEDRRALAYWYDRLVRTPDRDERHWRLEESITRHAERLMDAVLPAVEDFGQRLMTRERDCADLATLAVRRFAEDIGRDEVRRDALAAHNVLVDSKRPVGWHLVTGHIFTMSGEHWLCASPACDLVPSQARRWQKDAFGKHLPFIAVNLRAISVAKALQDASTNRYIFVRLKEEITAFRFNDVARPDSVPEWHVLYAADGGRFAEGQRFVVVRTKHEKDCLTQTREDAHIVAQLRYEYALNLVQKLGVSLTRIGLEFAGT